MEEVSTGPRKCGILVPMNGDIRIAVDIDQKTEDYEVPLKLKLVDESGREVPMYADVEDDDSIEQPVAFEKYPARVFINDGGNYKMQFTWTAADNSKRTFEEALEIPVPPQCPRCERRVSELTDYICDDCRYGY